MNQINANAAKQLNVTFNNMFQTGAIDQNTMNDLMRLVQMRQGGQRPNRQQMNPLRNLRRQFGNQLRPQYGAQANPMAKQMMVHMLKALMSGDLSGLMKMLQQFGMGNMMNPKMAQQGAQGGPQAFANAQGPGATAHAQAGHCGAKASANALPGGQAQALARNPGHCGPKPLQTRQHCAPPQHQVARRHCGPKPQAAQPKPFCGTGQANAIKGDVKGGWLVKHGQYKKDGQNFNITKGQYKDHKAIWNPQAKNFNIMNPQGRQVGTFAPPKGKKKIASPLTFDLNGNGKVDTTKGGKAFDINGDGKVDNTAWAGKGDGVLAFGNGKDGRELFGNNTDINGDGKSDGYKNGFDALRGFATKHLGEEAVADNRLDAKELSALEGKANLHIKRDGKKSSLKEAGIQEINLGYKEAGKAADANGNEHRQQGNFTRTDGKQGKVNDVWFQYQ